MPFAVLEQSFSACVSRDLAFFYFPIQAFVLDLKVRYPIQQGPVLSQIGNAFLLKPARSLLVFNFTCLYSLSPNACVIPRHDPFDL